MSAVLFSQLRQGDTVVLPSDGYHLLHVLRDRITGYGITVRTAPTGGDAQLPLVDGARLLWLETPCNPSLDVCDVRRLASAAHERGALVAVDNTLATPLGQHPLALGADFSLASGTKALSGHGDLLLGYVTCRTPELAAGVRAWRKSVGAVPGPIAHRSLATLQLRVDRQAVTALALARLLLDRPDVTGVRHPGLPQDPAHEVAKREMRHGRYGCVVSFAIPDRAHAQRFLAALRLVSDATSFGGVRSTAERRGRWGGDDVSEGFIRFSVGVKDTADLLADVRQALDAAADGPRRRRGDCKVRGARCACAVARGRPRPGGCAGASLHGRRLRGGGGLARVGPARVAGARGGCTWRARARVAWTQCRLAQPPPSWLCQPRFNAHRTARPRLVDSASVSNHPSDMKLSTYL